MKLTETRRQEWTPGWTSFAPVQVSDVSYLLSYKGESGDAALDRITA
ncbi:hypothetical protein ACFY04_04315 [Streptomyces sp. NPDC001549]